MTSVGFLKTRQITKGGKVNFTCEKYLLFLRKVSSCIDWPLIFSWRWDISLEKLKHNIFGNRSSIKQPLFTTWKKDKSAWEGEQSWSTLGFKLQVVKQFLCHGMICMVCWQVEEWKSSSPKNYIHLLITWILLSTLCADPYFHIHSTPMFPH